MIAGGPEQFRNKRVLLLQGPVGPFFWRLAHDLRWVGAQVCKVNFNGGDWLYFPTGAIAYRGTMADWPTFFSQLVTERRIDVVLLLGDCRPVHAAILDIATHHGIEVGVFEEGYVRPDYITFERSGVNGNSRIPRSPLFYLNTACPMPPESQPVGQPFRLVILWAMLYYFASALLCPLFRHYRHHRPLHPLEALPWLRAWWRKYYFRLVERRVEERLQSQLAGNYYLVPLQVHNDAQLHVHSGFESIPAFIRHVLVSFARYAPTETTLVIKHHPQDRGYRDYRRLIRREALRLGIANRVMAIHDQHLPSLLEHARGVVVINSTVGFSAVHHDSPVKVCGTAIYDMQGLTYQGTLDSFWMAAADERIDRTLYQRFRNYLISRTQLNGSFYTRLDIPGSHTGLVWNGAGRRNCLPDAGPGGIAMEAVQERHAK